jgi:hypothetical protein
MPYQRRYRRTARRPAAPVSGENIVQHFDSFTAFTDSAERHADASGASCETSFGAEWNGTDSLPAALRLARNGWADGADAIRKMLRPMSRAVAERTFHRVPNFAATRPGALHMGRYVIGHPKPFLTAYEVEETTPRRGGKVVHIVMNGTASAFVERSIMERRGAAVAALVDTLERAGKRVELDLVLCARPARVGGGSRQMQTWVRIKNAGDPVNLENLAFAIAHSSTLRRLGFAVWEGQPLAERQAFGFVSGGGYGIPENPTVEAGTVYLGAMLAGDPNFASEAAAVEWTLVQLREQGIEVE